MPQSRSDWRVPWLLLVDSPRYIWGQIGSYQPITSVELQEMLQMIWDSLPQRLINNRGVYTWGEWCEMHHGENWGECCDDNDAFARIIIYYYMNTFITLHQCTFNLLFALFSILISHCRCTLTVHNYIEMRF